MEGGDLDRRLRGTTGSQRAPAGCEVQRGAAHSRDDAADAPITKNPVARARPQPVFALAEWQLIDEALHKCVFPVAAQDRVITREIKEVEIAGAIVRPCVRAEGELLGVGVRRLEKQAAGEPAVQFHLKPVVVRRSGLEQEGSASCARCTGNQGTTTDYCSDGAAKRTCADALHAIVA